MPRALAVVLVCLMALGPAAPASAASMLVEEGGVLDFSIQVLTESVGVEIDLDEDERFVGAFTFALLRLGGGRVDFDVVGDPDPVIDYTLSVENLSDETQFVTYFLLMPMMPIGAASTASASLETTVVDGDGAFTFLGTLNPTIQQAVVSEDGIAATPLGVDVGLGHFPPGMAFASGPVAGPAPDPLLGPAFTFLAIHGGFSITPGDSATLVGNVTILPVPEPAVVLLLAAALVRLARRAG